MLFTDVVNSSNVPVLEKMLAFTQARHLMLTENIANADTPGYKTQHLDPAAFQASLREAIEQRKETGSKELRLEDGDQWRQDEAGRLMVTPVTDPAENILFHDGTNMRIERQMSMLAENAMMHQTVTELLRSQFELMMKSIRGQVV